jgi:hypothetical protein
VPRTFSAPERTKSKATVVRHVLRAEVRDVDDSWQDLRDLGVDGLDVLVGGTLSTTTDELVWRATVRVALGRGEEGTSPLLADSLLNRASGLYSPLLTPGAQIRLHADTLASGEAADESTKRLMFVGRIDRAEFASDPLTLTCRDLGGKLLDTIVREDRTYGDKDAPVAAHLVMQQFLDDNADIIGESITLSVPDVPTYVVDEFRQVGVSVLDALNTLAMLFGWVVRYKFDASDDFVLTLYDPLRDRVIPAGGDYLIEPTEYHEVNEAALDLTGVRNRLRGWFRDGVTGEALSVEVSDSGSILTFGERFEQFGGDLLLPITNGIDMLAFLQYALADQAAPPFDHTVKMMFLHFVSLGDVPELGPNDVHYDEAQQLAVVGITHEFPDSAQGASTTTIATRGTPSGAYKRWLRFRGGPVFPTIPPAPVIEAVLGEADSYGADEDDDSSGYDGGVWVLGRFNAGCVGITVYAELADGEGFSVDQTSSTVAIPDYRRPDGVEGFDPNFQFLFRLRTPAGFYKRITLVGRGASGLLSRENIWPFAIQAVDPIPTPDDGTIANIDVTKNPIGTEYTVTVTPGSVDTAFTNHLLVITRNGITVFKVPIGTSLDPVTFLDTGLTPQNTYQYETFILSEGCVSGPKNRYVFQNPPLSDAPQFTVGPVARIIDDVPKVYMEGVTGLAGADRMAFVKSLDQVNTETNGISSGLTPFIGVDPATNAKWYKLIAYSSTDPDIYAESQWRWWPGLQPTGSQGADPPAFTGDTPKLEMAGGGGGTIAIPVLAFRWTGATSGAVQTQIQESTDNGLTDPWTAYWTQAGLSGEYYDVGRVSTDMWYRVAALNTAGTALAWSAGEHYVP